MGDLKNFAEDISELFVKCFVQLNFQGPVLATLLGVIYKLDKEFVRIGKQLVSHCVCMFVIVRVTVW